MHTHNSETMSRNKIHTTIGLYANLDYKINGVCEENLRTHIDYNKTYRGGRALFVDGKCVYKGIGITDEEIEAFEQKIKNNSIFVRERDTAPYV